MIIKINFRIVATCTHQIPSRLSEKTSRLARRLLTASLVVALLVASITMTDAAVFFSRQDMSSLAFPDADEVIPHDFFLTENDRREIETLAGSKLESDLLSVYEGRLGGRTLGYAILDTHLVRTMAESLLVVVDPDGRVDSTYQMAFHEPLEYMPNGRWFRLLKDRSLTQDLRVGRDIAGITGSTLSTHAAIGAVRRALAVHQVLLAEPN